MQNNLSVNIGKKFTKVKISRTRGLRRQDNTVNDAEMRHLPTKNYNKLQRFLIGNVDK